VKHSTRIAGIAGASAIALSLMANPAFADTTTVPPDATADAGAGTAAVVQPLLPVDPMAWLQLIQAPFGGSSVGTPLLPGFSPVQLAGSGTRGSDAAAELEGDVPSQTDDVESASADVPAVDGSTAGVAAAASENATADDAAAGDPTADETATDDSTADDATADDATADDATADDATPDGATADDGTADDADEQDGTAAPAARPLPTVHRGRIRLADSTMTLGQYRKGLVAHLRGFKPGEEVAIGWGSADLQRGNLITTERVSAKGTLDLTFRPRSGSAQLATYSLSVYSATSAYAGPLARIAYTVKEPVTISWQAPKAVRGHLQLSAEVSKVAAATGRDVALRSAVVRFQEKVGSVWKTRKTVKANPSGVAVASVARSKHLWRALLVPTRTVRGTRTHTHTL
jgi:hypothetical protein